MHFLQDISGFYSPEITQEDSKTFKSFSCREDASIGKLSILVPHVAPYSSRSSSLDLEESELIWPGFC